MPQPVIVMKTVGGRQATVPTPITVHDLYERAAEAFEFRHSSLRLIRRGKLLSRRDGENQCVLVDSEDIVVVGARHNGPAVVKTPQRTDVKRAAPLSPIVGDPLPQSHCPDGLKEILGFSLEVASPLLPVFLFQHPTIEWMANFISGDHSRMELVLRQCQRDCPAFVEWVREHAELFLQLLNREPIVADITVDFSIPMRLLDDKEYVILHEEECDSVVTDEDDEEEVAVLQQREKMLHDLMLNTSQPLVRMQAMMHLAALYRNRFERRGDCEEQATRYTRDALSLAVDSYASFADAGTEIVSVFAAGEKWFAERHPFSALVARFAHMLFLELCEESSRNGWVRVIPDCFVEARRLCDFVKESSTTVVVLLPSFDHDGTELYVISDDSVMVRTVGATLDRMTAGVEFLSSLIMDPGREGLALKLWHERLTDLHHLFFDPITDLLPPCRDSESMLESAAPQVALLTPTLKLPVPFSAFLDRRGIPLLAKYAVFQSFSFRSLVDRKQKSADVSSVFDVEGQQPWMTRTLLRSLGATGKRRPNDRLTILHTAKSTGPASVDGAAADFVFIENFDGSFPIVRGCTAALIRAMPCREPLPYEFLRTFYILLADGVSLVRAVRQASMATAAVCPGQPWIWASMALLHGGEPLRALVPNLGGKLRQTALTAEARYCQDKSIHEIYDVMVNCLVAEKPAGEVAVLESLIECLCSKEGELMLLSAQAVREGEESLPAPVGSSSPAAV